jgi:hypothetical protein
MLHEAGIAILAGTDAPNPGTAYGVSMHRELELLVASGLNPAAALAAATSVPAARFGLEDRGRIERGLRADLVLVAGDPSQDILATRAIVAVWKNGYRLERQQQTAVAAAPQLADPVLGTIADGDYGWLATTDSIQGGSSTVTLAVVDGAFAVTGSVGTGAPWPWAGAMRMLGSEPMAPVDLGEVATLNFRIRGTGTGTAQVLFFSGSDRRAVPSIYPVSYGTQWQEVTIALASVDGLDASSARAVALVGGPNPGDFAFELDDVVLR